ncbi:MAG TPA: hypothetical protein VMY05_10660 [Acidobacteriota bacterium]|nr:hypothetical protein [Acidobacteriota bacterium]
MNQSTADLQSKRVAAPRPEAQKPRKDAGKRLLLALSSFLLLTVLGASVSAQGSIFGLTTNADEAVPEDSDLVFFGYLNETDDEVRLSISDGAGYENGQWYDDFQNFLSEAPGMPYDYLFFDTIRGEFFRLSKLIPDNSYQQEDVQLAPVAFPSRPTGLVGVKIGEAQVQLAWDRVAGLTCHVYRRAASSNGSFFRIDNPAGDLADPGADSAYVDTTATGTEPYSYMIMATDAPGGFSPPSAVATVDPGGCCEGLTGNVDQDAEDLTDIGDVTALIDFLFLSKSPLSCPGEANIDGDPEGLIDIGDLTALIIYLFLEPMPPAPCR